MARKRRKEVKFMKTLSLPLPVLNRLEEDSADKGMWESTLVVAALKAYWKAEDSVKSKRESIEEEIVRVITEEMGEISI